MPRGNRLQVLVRKLFAVFASAHPEVFNKSVEKFVEKPTLDYGKVKTLNRF